MKFVLLSIIISLLSVLSLDFVGSKNIVLAQNEVITKQLCDSNIDNNAACTEGGASDQLFGANGLVSSILNALSLLIGAVSVIVIVIGGFRFILSAGDPQSVAGARNQILYAIIGIIVAVFAQAIVRFALTAT